ncbi:MAG: Spy/CpxP family protein refolding chaperone [bacterium]
MKLKKKVFIFLFLSIGLGLFTSGVYADSQGASLDGDGALPEKKEAWVIYQQLNLSPEQDRQLQVRRNEHRKQAEELNKRMRAKREELKQELQKQELDREKINRLHAEFKVLLGQREDHRLEKILEVRKILTPEQLTRFLELIGKTHHGPEGKERNGE